MLARRADYFEGDVLHIEGETNHANDRRIVNANSAGEEINLFYRDIHHSQFTYFGLVILIQHELKIGPPSLFEFKTGRTAALAQSAIRTESRAQGLEEAEFAIDDEPEAEGFLRLSTHARYERSAKNRALSIKLHGHKCKACNFDFNSFYGADLARDFIQVHYTRSITELNGSAPDINIGLVPLSANCHSMAHREPGRIVAIAELHNRIQRSRLV